MEYILLYGGTIVICGIGIGLFYLAAQEIEEALPHRPIYLMILGNLLIAWFLRWYCKKSVPSILKYLTIVTVLCVCAWTDYKKYLILNRILGIALVMRLIWLMIEFMIYESNDFTYILVSSLIAAGMLAIGAFLCKLVSSGGVGYGDVKLLFILGLFTGTEAAIAVMIDAFIVMFIISVILLLTKKANRKTVIPFAPFLLTGTIAASLLTGI